MESAGRFLTRKFASDLILGFSRSGEQPRRSHATVRHFSTLIKHVRNLGRPMRQLSKRTQYSLRALYALARGYGKGPLLISHLAEEEAIPKKFLEQILLSLK